MKKMIPDCYWPSSKNGVYVSHEAVCILNEGDTSATVRLTLYFEDRDPVSGYQVEVPPCRTRHIRMDQLCNAAGEPVPQDTPYAVVITSDADLTAQYTRVDTTQAELSIMTTML